jgi:RimK family alpha-L-glutamate ligase
MKTSFAIIGPRSSQNTIDLCHAIEKIGCSHSVYAPNDISLDMENISRNAFFSHDIYLFRGYHRSVRFVTTVSKILHDQGKTVIDSILYNTIVRDKCEESVLLKINDIRQPRTYYARKLSQWKTLLKDAEYPLIIKPIDGQQGKDIYKCMSFSDVENIIVQDEKKYMAQDFLELDGDIRVFIVGDHVLGAIKRFVVKNDFRSNASLGARAETYHLSPQESDLALKAHQAIGYDISGVDMASVDGISYIIEVNHTPQWQTFKQTNGVDPAEHIINFALQKYEKNRF